MGKPFHPYFFAPACADGSWDDRFFASRRRGRGSGVPWSEESRRRRRGDIKFLLLALLAEQPRHGYELIKELENRYGGFRRLSPGSVYPTLQLLEEGGYLTSETVEGKRVYSITQSGQELLREQGDRTPSPESEPAAELIELRQSFMELGEAVRLIARSGTPEQVSLVREKLAQLKREIFKLLADQ